MTMQSSAAGTAHAMNSTEPRFVQELPASIVKVSPAFHRTAV